MTMTKWLVIGVGGATCSGKTSIATALHKLLPNSVLIKQDDYFYDEGDVHHIKVPVLNHTNYEIMSSLNMHAMQARIEEIVNSNSSYSNNTVNCIGQLRMNVSSDGSLQRLNQYINEIMHFPCILIIEGFLIMNAEFIRNRCDLRIVLVLDKNEMWTRRRNRIYNPPDPDGYFELCVYPHYVRHLSEVMEGNKHDLLIINGANALADNIDCAIDAAFKMICLDSLKYYL